MSIADDPSSFYENSPTAHHLSFSVKKRENKENYDTLQ